MPRQLSETAEGYEPDESRLIYTRLGLNAALRARVVRALQRESGMTLRAYIERALRDSLQKYGE